MKAVVGFMFFMLFLAGFAFVMLQGRQTSRSGPSIADIDWRPVSVGATAIPDDGGMSVRFARNGDINGHGGCNRFFGALKRTESGVEVGQLGATRMACPEAVMAREAAFIDAIQNTRNVQSDGATLRLLDADGGVLAELVADAGD